MNEFVDSYFSTESLPQQVQPAFVMVVGVICAGKTTHIQQHFGKTHVSLDAGRIYLQLNEGSWSYFGKKYEDEMKRIGQAILTKAVVERRNIVVEVLGYTDIPQIKAIYTGFKKRGYRTIMVELDCELETAVQRNASREKNNISAYFTESYHINWLLDVLGL